MQYHLLKIGSALGYDVLSAANDRSRKYQGMNFSALSLNRFPNLSIQEDAFATIKMVDVLWFEKGSANIVCAFEVEKSTSIYSGIGSHPPIASAFFQGPEIEHPVHPFPGASATLRRALPIGRVTWNHIENIEGDPLIALLHILDKLS